MCIVYVISLTILLWIAAFKLLLFLPVNIPIWFSRTIQSIFLLSAFRYTHIMVEEVHVMLLLFNFGFQTQLKMPLVIYIPCQLLLP